MSSPVLNEEKVVPSPSIPSHADFNPLADSDAPASPINILVLEDQANDSEFIMRKLVLAGLDIQWKRVDNEADYLEQLSPHWHVILADYHLPTFDAIRALHLLRQRELDIPFIILSGGVGDEFIVEAMKQGASDFLLKDRTARLPTAIRQALERKRLRLCNNKTEHALHLIEQRYGMLAKVSPVGILHFDAHGDCFDVNERWCDMAGLDRPHALGQGWTTALHPDDYDAVLLKWSSAVESKTIFNLECRFLHPDGSITWVVNEAMPEIAPDGSLNGFVGITTDITKHKLIENALRESEEQERLVCEQLEQKNIKLNELYDTAQRFVDDVSHEFRTPLAVIKGYAEIINAGIAGPTSSDQTKFTQLIVDRAHDMTQMVDDLLDTSKLRAGSLRVDRRPVYISDIISAVRQTIQGRASASNIEWVEDVPLDLPLVFADAEKAGRVLTNLAMNACKFSPDGSRILLTARPVNRYEVILSVTDQGAGISPENLAAIFERFRQVGTQTTSKGFGLGLNIAKKLSALNLGQLSVESQLQKGSTFSFTLPVYDSVIILARLFEYLESVQTPPGIFAVIRVTPDRDGPITEQLRSFVACSAHPGDLILPANDNRSLVLFGYSAKPHKWLNRLVTAGKNIQQYSAAQKLCGFTAKIVSEIPYPCLVQDAFSLLFEHLSGDYSHA